jgi:hypothetical protein
VGVDFGLRLSYINMTAQRTDIKDVLHIIFFFYFYPTEGEGM